MLETFKAGDVGFYQAWLPGDTTYRYKYAAASDDTTNPKDRLGVKKPPLHLVPPALALWVSLVFKESAPVYGPYNWREKNVRLSVYLDAIERHLLQMKDGQDLDAKSGLPHVAHIGANVAILLDAAATGNLINDLGWKAGPAEALIKKMTEPA